MRPLLMEAGKRITAKEAERRVLILENPGLRGKSGSRRVCMPDSISDAGGNCADSPPRASALRFVIESDAVIPRWTASAPPCFPATSS